MKKRILFMIPIISLSCVNYSYNNKNITPKEYLTYDKFKQDFKTCNASSQSNSMITYFKNLSDFSPKNSYGSCGFVSFIQYLSYYDTFYNDNIIPEKYEKNYDGNDWESAMSKSPGVLRQDYPKSSNELYNYVENNKNVDYQAYLMSIVNNDFGNDENNFSYEIGMWNYYRIVNSISCLSSTKFEYTSCLKSNYTPTSSNVVKMFDNYVKNQLDKGNPVMLHICKYNENGTNDKEKYQNYHSVVAYYYDELGIHANFGYDSYATDTIISNEYSITDARVIDFSSVNVVHSDNYKIKGSGNCGCKKHVNHYYTYTYKNNSQHLKSCFCGDNQLMSHIILSGSDYTIGNKRYGKCIDCNTIINLDSSGVIVIDEYKNYITNNGSYRLDNGIIILSEKDYELYKKGELILD